MKTPASALSLVVVCLAGCHTYAPVGVGAVSPGETVRARLTDEARGEFAEAITGPNRLLEGELVDRQDGELTLAVVSTVRQQGFFSENLHQRIRLQTSDIVELERRALDRTRTYLTVGAGAAALMAVVLEVFSGKTGGNTVDRTDQGPSAIMIPWFTIRR